MTRLSEEIVLMLYSNAITKNDWINNAMFQALYKEGTFDDLPLLLQHHLSPINKYVEYPVVLIPLVPQSVQ